MPERLRPLPTPWNVYNLRGSPYWQEALGDEDDARPLSLFVGRQADVAALQTTLRGAEERSSRQAITGRPGVGKTTLVKEFKARARADDFLTLDDFVALVSEDTAEKLFGRVLSLAYDTIIANRPQTFGNAAMTAAQALVRAARIETGGGGISAFGFGGNASRSVTHTIPRDMLIDGPRVLRNLLTLVRESGARGLLLHLNNTENLSDEGAAAAAVLLRDLRDPLLMHPGLHVVIAGTTDAIQTIIGTYEQVETVFSTHLLDPLAPDEVQELLAKRYEHLALDPARPVIPPVDATAVATLHALFRGDLRGLFKALEDGVPPNIGLHESAARTLTADDLRPVLQIRYADRLATNVEAVRAEQLSRWGTTRPTSEETQASLQKLWKLKSQGTVSTAVRELMRKGYVLALPRRGNEPIRYVLAGKSRLIFG